MHIRCTPLGWPHHESHFAVDYRPCLTLLWLVSAAPLQAEIIWTVEAPVNTIPVGSGGAGDLLGIDGETITYSFTFDDSAVWTDIGGELYVPTIDTEIGITGPHTISFGSPSPAARIRSANNASVPVEAVGTAGFVDFVIDGTPFITTGDTNTMVPLVIHSMVTC